LISVSHLESIAFGGAWLFRGEAGSFGGAVQGKRIDFNTSEVVNALGNKNFH
jgi:hypothetical protein